MSILCQLSCCGLMACSFMLNLVDLIERAALEIISSENSHIIDETGFNFVYLMRIICHYFFTYSKRMHAKIFRLLLDLQEHKESVLYSMSTRDMDISFKKLHSRIFYIAVFEVCQGKVQFCILQIMMRWLCRDAEGLNLALGISSQYTVVVTVKLAHCK